MRNGHNPLVRNGAHTVEHAHGRQGDCLAKRHSGDTCAVVLVAVFNDAQTLTGKIDPYFFAKPKLMYVFSKKVGSNLLAHEYHAGIGRAT